MILEQPRFHVIKRVPPQEIIFDSCYWYKNVMYYIMPVIVLKRLRIVMHNCEAWVFN